MAENLSGLILKSNFDNIKKTVNELVQARKYGQRALDSYKITTNITKSQLIDDSQGQSIISVYQRFISSDASIAPDPIIKQGQLISGAEFSKAETTAETYKDTSKYNNNYKYSGFPNNYTPIPTQQSKEVGCGGFCTGLCVTTCSLDCKSSCTGHCGDSCTGSCSKSCSVLCSSCTGCTGKCQQACTNSCSGCGGGCSAYCASSCEGDCHSYCAEGDNSGAHCSVCTNVCSKECENSCAYSCKGGTSHEDCNGQCIAACGAALCMSTCNATCFGFCNSTCGSDCSGSCTYGCTDGCDSQLSQRALDTSSVPFTRSITITESGEFTVPANVNQIYVFAVGGGGGSSCSYWTGSYESMIHYYYNQYGQPCGGAGGGYTNDGYFDVTPGQIIPIHVGKGGPGGILDSQHPTYKGFTDNELGKQGEETFIQINKSTTLRASGGFPSGMYYDTTTKTIKFSPTSGGCGGSGGGRGWDTYMAAGNGGIAGSDGRDRNEQSSAKGQISYVPSGIYSNGKPTICKYNKKIYGCGGGGGGSNDTSRESGPEQTYKVVSCDGGQSINGGGAGASPWGKPNAGQKNTGGGAGGCSAGGYIAEKSFMTMSDGAAGGSGIAIIYY